MQQEGRTAIVTGAGKRVGAVIAEALVRKGWSVVGHVRSVKDEPPQGAIKAVADLADPHCAQAIFKAAVGLPPLRLLVNNAARFAHDGFGEFSLAEFDAHMAVNLRAPMLLTEAFVARHEEGEDSLIVNILDSKIAAPNPDFLSYTVSKQALAGYTELAARQLAPRGIRVNAIAPALMLPSAGQSAENFAAMHRRNPLRRGVDPQDVVRAIDYLLDAPTMTGQVLTLDGGQRFESLARDVQFLEAHG